MQYINGKAGGANRQNVKNLPFDEKTFKNVWWYRKGSVYLQSKQTDKFFIVKV
jgi:hypothetical protein